jgi:hypothetical protein
MRRKCSRCHGTGYIGTYEAQERRPPERGEWSKEPNHWKQGEADLRNVMNLTYKEFEVDGVRVKFSVEESEVTVWAYRDRGTTYDIETYDEGVVDQIVERPAWVEIGSFNPRDYM